MIEKRGRPKEIIIEPPSRKFTKTYEDEHTIEIWTYNLDKHHGPISVDIKYKEGYDKGWAKRQKNVKDMKHIERKQRKKQQLKNK